MARPDVTVTMPPEPPRSDAGRRRPRSRRMGGTILLPPWSRAPRLTFGEPIVLLAVFAATAILACAAASAPLLLTSTASASVQRQLSALCPDAAWPSVTVASYPSSQLAERDTRVPVAMTGAGLAEPALEMSAGGSVALDSSSGRSNVQLFYREEALNNINIVRSVEAEGVLLPASTAETAGLTAGDTVTMLGSAVTVAGIYADLDREPTSEFWCSYEPLFRFIPTISAPLPLVIATDPDTVYRLTADDPLVVSGNLLRQPITRSWVSPIDTANITRAAGRDVISQQDAALRSAGDGTDLRIAGDDTLQSVVARTERIEGGLVGPVIPIAVTGAAIALILVAAAGRFWADRRRREVRLLSSRGVGPGPLAVKAALELILAVLGGTIAGFFLAQLLVTTVGPSDDLEPAAVRLAVLTVAVGFVVGLALLGLTAGLRARNTTERPIGSGRHWIARIPLELLPLAAAGYCWLAVRGEDPVVIEAGVAKLNLLVVAFPLLFLVGAAPLVIRILIAGLPAIRRRASGWNPATFLAVNRLAANRGISGVVLAAVAIPVGVFGYAVTMTATTQATLEAKAQVFVGSDRAVSTFDDARSTADLDRISTRVIRFQDVTVGGQSVQVLAIDLDTFAETAYWDSRFADQPIENLLGLLAVPDGAGAVPALAVGLPAGEQELVFEPDQPLAVAVVATPRVFPGIHVDAPLVILDADRLGPILTEGADRRTEFWTRGPAEPVLDQLEAQQVRVFTVFDRDRVFVVANFLGVSFTFGYLVALAAFMAVIGLAGLLLYVETRQRSRTAAYAFVRRMGLTRRGHARAIRRELAVLLGLGSVVGAGLASIAVITSYPRFDIDPMRAPSQLLTLPVLPYALVVVIAVLTTVAVAAYVQRVTDRADQSAVLRLGG